MPFECYPVVVLKCHAVYMYLQFIQHWLLLWNLSKLKDHYTWYMYGIYHAYTWYMSCIYKVFLIWSFEGELRFLIISCFNIKISSIIALAYSTHKSMIIKFWYPLYIPGIYQVYTASWNIHGIYIVYTDYTIPRRGSRSVFGSWNAEDPWSSSQRSSVQPTRAFSSSESISNVNISFCT
jgi:hypothetical protein